jgi:carboxylate-amine ligase
MTMPRQVGVEEEMFLVDPATRRPVATSDQAVDAADSDDEVEQELFLQQVETQSAPHHDLADLFADLASARRKASEAAEDAGALLAAVPTPVLPHDQGDVTPKPRYERMVRRYGEIGRRALVCGTHVHVDVDGDEEGVAVIDRLTPWLPLVLALSANSPYDFGIDTGYASWRAEVWESWPSAGAVEPFGDASGYHRAVAAIIDSGAAIDEAMIYFDARLSRTYPTVEIRVADACTELGVSVLIAAVLRSLVDTCAAAATAGTPLDPWRVDLSRAARWRARRDGLAGSLVDPLTSKLVPAGHALDTLIHTIGPALARNGDRELVEDGIARLLDRGAGADRQRSVAGERLDLVAVVDDIVERTRASAVDST